MRLTTTNPALRALYDEDLMGDHYDAPGITFHSTGTSQEVAEVVGERLIEHYDDIEPRNS